MLATSISLEQALRRLGWIESHAHREWIVAATEQASSECLFRVWLQHQPHGESCLTGRGREELQRLLSAGWTLRGTWPRTWAASIERWLGPRLYLAHTSLFADTTRFTTLISSRIGRHGSGQPNWPLWMDAALRHVRQQRCRLLIAPGTTLAEVVEQFAIAADMLHTKICWTKPQPLVNWLEAILGSSELASGNGAASREKIFLSPAVEPVCAALAEFPLQDRLSIAVADQVLSLAVRDGGKLEELLRQRLQEAAFPSGSVFVTLPATAPTGLRSGAVNACSTVGQAWLSRGAVGWIVPAAATHSPRTNGRCRARGQTFDSAATAAGRSLQQLASPLPDRWRHLSAEDDSPYLVHCTRATSGPLPSESEPSFRQRVWSQADPFVWQPLQTLMHICHEGRLRATANLTRTDMRCVSFSAVPLAPLLKRRTFRSHLGRWDWEPYGLLVHRDALQAVGGREVIYGDEADFSELHAAQQPFFQPHHSQRRGEDISWAQEREWRVPGDVRLRMLPPDAVLLFVRWQWEAYQLSRHAPWPVLWLGEL